MQFSITTPVFTQSSPSPPPSPLPPLSSLPLSSSPLLQRSYHDKCKKILESAKANSDWWSCSADVRDAWIIHTFCCIFNMNLKCMVKSVSFESVCRHSVAGLINLRSLNQNPPKILRKDRPCSRRNVFHIERFGQTRIYCTGWLNPSVRYSYFIWVLIRMEVNEGKMTI